MNRSFRTLTIGVFSTQGSLWSPWAQVNRAGGTPWNLRISQYVKPLIIPNNPKGFNLGSPLL